CLHCVSSRHDIVSLPLFLLTRYLTLSPFFFSAHRDYRLLHSFPTRRSSDLTLTMLTSTSSMNAPVMTIASTAQGLSIVITGAFIDRKSTRLNSSHVSISYAVFCLKKKKKNMFR